MDRRQFENLWCTVIDSLFAEQRSAV